MCNSHQGSEAPESVVGQYLLIENQFSCGSLNPGAETPKITVIGRPRGGGVTSLTKVLALTLGIFISLPEAKKLSLQV
jgi:hypothetical protein